jgi:membrane-bound serine protease (ClpP class)
MIIMAIVEALTVSMGIFIALSVLSGLMSVFMGFRASQTVGYTMLGVNAFLFPICFFLTMRYLRRSPMMLDDAIAAGVPKEKKRSKKAANELMGQEGVALTDLRPAGTAQFDEKRLDVVTDGKYVQAGQKVRVIKVSGFMTVVEPCEVPSEEDSE